MSIQIKKLCGGYNNKDVCSSISFCLREGEITALVGPNGSGKTTLLKLILGLLKKTDGSIIIDNKDSSEYSQREYSKILAYIPQYYSIEFSVSVLDMVVMGRNNSIQGFSMPKPEDIMYARNVLKKLRMDHLENEYYESLSGGWKQMVLIARAVCQNARVLVMDEPTSSLDYFNQSLVIDTIGELSKNGYSILISSHDLNQPNYYAHKTIILKDGKTLAYGFTNEILTQENLSKAYGVDIEVLTTKDNKNANRTFFLPRNYCSQ